MNELSLEEKLYPQIDGSANYSILNQGSKAEFSVEDIQVNVFLPAGFLESRRDYLTESKAKILHNGNLVEEIPLQREWGVSGEGQLCKGKGKKRFTAEAGDTFAVVFTGTAMTKNPIYLCFGTGRCGAKRQICFSCGGNPQRGTTDNFIIW